jgi:phosphoribosylformylglycinamidine synthase
VSLYNESRGRDIDPTPVVGTLGLIETLERRPPGGAFVAGADVLLLGEPAADALGGSRWAHVVHEHEGGALPALDLAAHVQLLELVRGLAADGVVAGLHDVSDGGLAVALAEMAVRGGIGCRVAGAPVATHARLFSEAPSRVVVVVDPARRGEVERRAADEDIACTSLGSAGGDRVVLGDLVDVALDRLRDAWRDAIPMAVAGDL